MNILDFSVPIPKNSKIEQEIFYELKRILKLEDIKSFLGNHPVNLSNSRLDFLLEEDYLVCEKTDGIRTMLLIYGNKLFLYDRTNSFYLTDFTLRCNTIFLFDGELYKTNTGNIYSIFDVLVFAGKSAIQNDLLRRLGFGKKFYASLTTNPIVPVEKPRFQSFKVVAKEMYKSYGLESVIASLSNLEHQNDGLVFTPVNEPYVPYQRSKILKWKPPSLNTVDFRIKKTNMPGIYEMYCDAEPEQVSLFRKKTSCKVEVQMGYFYTDDSPELDNKIGEFAWNPEKEVYDIVDGTVLLGGWELHRMRMDKSDPNNIKIVLDLLYWNDNILTSETLIETAKDIRENYKAREKSDENNKRMKEE